MVMKLLQALFLSFLASQSLFAEELVVQGTYSTPTPTPISMNIRMDLPQGSTIPIYINCDFRQVSVDCQEVINGFFSQKGFSAIVKQVDRPEKAWVVLKLSSEMTAAGDEVIHYDWTPIERLPVSKFSYQITLQAFHDSLSKLNTTILNISPYLNFLLNAVSASATEGRLTTVSTVTGTVSEPEKEKPWFISTSVSGRMNNQSQTSRRSAFGSASYNYSADKYRFMVNGFADYSKETVSDGQGGELKAENFSRFLSGTAVWSFSKKWSAAVIVEGGSDPGSNIRSLNEIQTGVEWSLVPFRINENRELLFRVGVSAKSLALNEMNVNGNVKEKFMNAFANIYMYWLFWEGKATVSVNARARTNLKYRGFESYSAGTNFRFQLTKTLDINGGASYGFTAKSITFPAKPDYSNPLQFQLIGNQPGGSLSMNFGFGLTIGNGLKRARDRRWSVN